MGRRHGRKRHMAVCGCTRKSACYTTWDAAMAAVKRIPDAIRAVRGSCCGHYHITRMTADEYAQRVAEFSCTTDEECGTVDLGQGTETYNEDQDLDAGGEPRGDEGRPGEASLLCGASSRPAPSPAALAARLQARRDPRVA